MVLKVDRFEGSSGVLRKTQESQALKKTGQLDVSFFSPRRRVCSGPNFLSKIFNSMFDEIT